MAMGHSVSDCTRFRARVHHNKGVNQSVAFEETASNSDVSRVRAEARRMTAKAAFKRSGGTVELQGLSRNWKTWTTLSVRHIAPRP